MSGRFIIGLILILLGAGFLVDRLGYWDFGLILSSYWPLILIFLGLMKMFRRHIISGGIILLIGLWFQLRNLNLIPENIWVFFWPVILILVGIWFLVPRARRVPSTTSSSDLIHHTVIFGGLEDRNNSQQFKGGEISAIFGGAELNFRDAKLASSGATLELTAIFGGIEIKVPEDWIVVSSGVPLFGGLENKAKRQKAEDPNAPTLNVSCTAIFGGVEISN